MRPSLLDRSKSMSLKWKIVLPFLFLAFAGTTILAYIGLTSQQVLIRGEEEHEIFQQYDLFLEDLESKKNFVLALATMIAESPEVQRLLANRDREDLYELMLGIFRHLKTGFQIHQIHFHIPPGTSFLRVHHPELFGDDLTPQRRSVVDAMKDKMPKTGIEQGRTGYGIRAVVPVFYGVELAGTVEVGYSFGGPLLLQLHERWAMNLCLYSLDEKGQWTTMALASKWQECIPVDPGTLKEAMTGPVFVVLRENEDLALLMGPIRDYSGNLIAILQLSLDRTETKKRLAHTRNIMLVVGVSGITLSFLLTYLVALFLIRPITAIVGEAQEIAEGKRESHVKSRPKDEIGTLSEALNLMLDALQARRSELERYAKTLEKKVEDRTAALVASEEKYRTLVEHVPLVVYRILADGTTEFVNSYLTEILGYSAEEAVSDRHFWFKKIWGCERAEYDEMWRKSFEGGEGYRIERMVRDRKGRLLTFIDHAIPTKNEPGKVLWVDGIMMDITELKSFQEMALRTEEIRLLEEISAHMAHAIRNPLSSAGGFARRLQNALPGNDPNRRLAEIIVKEVVRIEDFLKVLFSSIRPFDLSYGEVDINQLLTSLLARLEGPFRNKEIEVKLSFSQIPKIQADEERLGEALENILKHASVLIQPKETLHISTELSADRITIAIMHRITLLSQDDLDKFFFPHIEENALWPIIDLSHSRRIIHRHGGKIDIYRLEKNYLLMKIDLPVRMGR